jgi:adenosylcobinamide-GDP ribazoletransferase
MDSWRLALGFLTAIPVRSGLVEGGLGRAAVWFPAVGLVLGALLAAAGALLSLVFPPLLTAGLVVVLWAALTGGLHLDGLADCCDGLFAAVPRERRLEIMRDPHLGAFGAIGLALFLILKVAALAAILSTPPAALSASGFPHSAFRIPHSALLLAPTLARLLLLPVALLPPARPGGLGAGFAQGLKPARIALAAVLPLALILLAGWGAAAAAMAAGGAAALAAWFARARLGGVTGDVLGLTVELSELAALLMLAALLA